MNERTYEETAVGRCWANKAAPSGAPRVRTQRRTHIAAGKPDVVPGRAAGWPGGAEPEVAT